MNTAATSNYQETSQFIHQRYEDTAFIIFQQQQKIRQDEKRREQQQPKSAGINRPFLPVTSYPPEFSRFGNRGVIATEKETVTTKTVSKGSEAKSPVTLPSKSVTPTRTQPAVKSSEKDQPESTVVRRHSRQRRKVVVSFESSV